MVLVSGVGLEGVCNDADSPDAGKTANQSQLLLQEDTAASRVQLYWVTLKGTGVNPSFLLWPLVSLSVPPPGKS